MCLYLGWKQEHYSTGGGLVVEGSAVLFEIFGITRIPALGDEVVLVGNRGN